MKLIGFNFQKISIDKKKESIRDLKINTNINLSNIEEAKSELFKTSGEVLIRIGFDYYLNYEPEIAKIEFSGVILLSLDEKKAKELINKWKDKKVPEDFKIALFNLILKKSNIKAIQLEDEMNLPIHIQFPSLKKEAKKEN